MKLAVLTPLPPVRSGIAHYSAVLLPELARRHELTAVVDQDVVEFDGCRSIRMAEFQGDAGRFDAVICQMGNNPHHEFVWNWARARPSVVVLHEIVLHHLLVECTLARGDAGGLVEALGNEYGTAGARLAEARVAGLHGEIANFLFPASAGLANGATHVIVHNEWAATRLREEGVTTPITVVPHPFDPPPSFPPEEVERVRREAGWSGGVRIIGAFGFVTSAKRPEVVMEAFGRAARRNRSLRLVFVGESAPNVDLESLASRFGVARDLWRSTGYVTDREFDLWMNVADRVVSLRYPTAGESSGPIVRAFAVGRPVAVSAYAQFAEFPGGLVFGIPFDDEVTALADFMADDTIDVAAIGTGQRTWLAGNASVRHAADGYDRALSADAPRSRGVAVQEGIPLHPEIDAAIEEVKGGFGRTSIAIRLTNRGATTLRCALWGQPHYLVHATVVSDDGSRSETGLSLPGDLRSGESTSIELEGERITRVELRHALSAVPGSDEGPFAVLEPGS
jgi:glycosyltransferase involved in cell wall biosynthesis